MDATSNYNAPARGKAAGAVVWDRASWHTSGTADRVGAAESSRHILLILRWLWSRGLTTAQGDLAAQGDFSAVPGAEPALMSTMVVEDAAVFLDHYYGPWLSSLLQADELRLDDETLDALWSEYEQRRDGLDRVWEI